MKTTIFILLMLAASCALGQRNLFICGDSKSYLKPWMGELTGWDTLGPPMSYSGWYVTNLRDTVDEWLPRVWKTPEAILMNIGGSDVNVAWGGVRTRAEFLSAYAYVLDALHAKWPSAKIYCMRVWSRLFQQDWKDSVNIWINLSISARSSFAYPGPNEDIWLKGTDNGASETYDGTHYTTPYGNDLCAQQWLAILNPEVTQKIVMNPGWNIVSSYAIPGNLALDSVFSKIRPRVVIAKNGAGAVYWPAFGIDQIGAWNVYQGFLVYMQSTDTLVVKGKELQPDIYPMAVSSGWNLVGYMRNSPMRSDSALSSLGGSLVIAKDNAGQVYWPAFGINQIGNMRPGRGYQVYLTTATTLNYPANITIAPPSALTKRAAVAGTPQKVWRTEYYNLARTETGSSEILLVECPDFEDGDEVGVWDAKHALLGAGVASEGKAVVTVWGDDRSTDLVDGASEGETLVLTLWSKAKMAEREAKIASVLNGLTGQREDSQLKYKSDGVWIVQVAGEGTQVPAQFALEQNYPNPFNPSTTIGYTLPGDGRVTLVVQNLLGQTVATLVDEEQRAGYHTAVFQVSDLSSSVYLYTLKQGNYAATKKLTFLK